jgi:hypothetical protein
MREFPAEVFEPSNIVGPRIGSTWLVSKTTFVKIVATWR